jgi:hypothetical protein
MADELEKTVEGTPEQGEMFTQPAVAPEPVVEAPPAPAPEPAPAEPPPPVEPEWLNAPAEPPPQEPQYAQQPQQMPPQYPQQSYVQPPAPASDAALQSFVDNPDGWFEQRMAAREQQMLGPMQNMMGNMMQTQAVQQENQVNEGLSRADIAVRNAYEQFNNDTTFRSSKAMQDKIGATLQGMRQRAESEARRGNFTPINALANLSPSDVAGTLAYVRAAAGVQSPGVAPVQVEGATVESSRSTVAAQPVEIDPDTEAAIKRLGPAYRERYVKALQEASAADDFEG